MFEENDVKVIFDNLITNYPGVEDQDKRIKYIHNKIEKHGYLYINLSELNYLFYVCSINKRYDVKYLKQFVSDTNIGYTAIIKNTGIAKATLSKLLNNERNVKLVQLNDFIDKMNKSFKLKLSKDNMKEGE